MQVVAHERMRYGDLLVEARIQADMGCAVAQRQGDQHEQRKQGLSPLQQAVGAAFDDTVDQASRVLHGDSLVTGGEKAVELKRQPALAGDHQSTVSEHDRGRERVLTFQVTRRGQFAGFVEPGIGAAAANDQHTVICRPHMTVERQLVPQLYLFPMGAIVMAYKHMAAHAVGHPATPGKPRDTEQ